MNPILGDLIIKDLMEESEYQDDNDYDDAIDILKDSEPVSKRVVLHDEDDDSDEYDEDIEEFFDDTDYSDIF